MKQISFLQKINTEHGGVLAIKKRKTLRPLTKSKAVHMVLKSRTAVLFKNKNWILEILRKQARNSGVRIDAISVQRDHIHLVIRIYSRQLYKAFIRASTGLIARRLGKGLWKLLPFTRLINWGRDYKTACAYVFQNEMEVLEIWKYRPRAHRKRARQPHTQKSVTQQPSTLPRLV